MATSVALDPNNTAARNKEELVKALTSWQGRGGTLRLPRSNVPIPMAPGTVWPAQRNLELIGDGPAAGYEDSQAATQLKFTAGSIGIDCSQIDISDPAAPYAVISGISLNGDNVCAQGLKGGGIMHIPDLDANRFTEVGVWFARLINSCTVGRLSVYGCGLYGALVGGDTETNPNNTRLTIDELIARANGVGMRWVQAMSATVWGGTVESNFGPGMQFYRQTNGLLEDILTGRVWFEGNGRGEAVDAITIDGDGVAPENIRFDGTRIAVGGQSRAINAIRLNGGKFENMTGSGAVTLGANCVNTKLLDMPAGFAITDNGSGNYVGPSIPSIGGAGLPIIPGVSLADASATLTAAQIINTRCQIVPTANRTLTVPSAASIISAFGGYVANGAGEFTIMNRGSGPTVALASSGGTTVDGNSVIGQGSGHFGVVMTGEAAVTIFNKSIH